MQRQSRAWMAAMSMSVPLHRDRHVSLGSGEPYVRQPMDENQSISGWNRHRRSAESVKRNADWRDRIIDGGGNSTTKGERNAIRGRFARNKAGPNLGRSIRSEKRKSLEPAERVRSIVFTIFFDEFRNVRFARIGRKPRRPDRHIRIVEIRGRIISGHIRMIQIFILDRASDGRKK